MSENIRNIGRQLGELQAHFATLENTDVMVRGVQRAIREPIMPVYTGILDTLSSLWGGTDFVARNVDNTGVSRKLTLMSKVTYALKAKPDDTAVTDNKVFEKNVFMHVGIPDIVSADVKSGLSPIYPNPAISEAEFAAKGAYNERSSQRSFANRYALDRNTYMTAAAMQMAYCYMNYFLLPRLGDEPEGFHIAAIPGADHRANPTSYETCLMPAELATHHKPSVLSLVHFALTANDILGVIDPDNNNSRVFNAVGDLDGTGIDESDFWEAWHLLKHSSQGTSNSDQWDIDFLLLIIQNFPVHGISEEGGVWRNLLKNYAVCPNACVITSDFRANTIGYSNIMDRMIIGSAACLQTIISRALYESNVDNTKFMLQPNPSGSEVNTVLQSMREDIISKLFEATHLPVDYWEQYLTTPNFQMLSRDRHIMREEANFLKNFSPFMMTYPLGISGDRLGRNEFIRNNPQPLVFSGEYSTKIIELDNSLYAEVAMQEDMTFANGLFYLNPKVNPDDGMMGMINRGTFSGSNQALDEHVPLVDGRLFSYGQSVAEVIWTDNRDVVPTTGDMRSVYACSTLLEAAGMPSWVMRGDYKVSVGRYYATTPEPKESRAPSRTRVSLINARSGNTYADPFGTSRPRITSVETYLKAWKRYSVGKARNVVNSSTNARRREKEKNLMNMNLSDFAEREVEDKLLYDSRVRGEQFERIKNFNTKMRVMVSDGAYEFDDGDRTDWQDVVSSLDKDFEFTFLTNSEIRNLTKDRKKVKVFEYGMPGEAREWDDDFMLSDVQSLLAKIDILMNQKRVDYIAMAMAISGPLAAAAYDLEISNGLQRASRDRMPDLKVSKISGSLSQMGKSLAAFRLSQEPVPIISTPVVVSPLEEHDVVTGVPVEQAIESVHDTTAYIAIQPVVSGSPDVGDPSLHGDYHDAGNSTNVISSTSLEEQPPGAIDPRTVDRQVEDSAAFLSSNQGEGIGNELTPPSFE